MPFGEEDNVKGLQSDGKTQTQLARSHRQIQLLAVKTLTQYLR